MVEPCGTSGQAGGPKGGKVLGQLGSDGKTMGETHLSVQIELICDTNHSFPITTMSGLQFKHVENTENMPSILAL